MAILTTTRGSSRLCRTLLCVFLVCEIPAARPLTEQVAEEYHVKASFLYNFARFVEWPSGTFHSQQEPFQICVLGADPFGNALEETFNGKQLDGRPFRISRISAAVQAATCQIIFICPSERRRLIGILADLPASGVLSVSEMDGFAASGGMINFTLTGGRVRFQVNPHAAERARLQISSRLLSLAQVVDP